MIRCAAYPPERAASSCDFSPRGGFSAECSRDPSCRLSATAPGAGLGREGLGWSVVLALFALLGGAHVLSRGQQRSPRE